MGSSISSSSIVEALRPLVVDCGSTLNLQFWDGRSETLGSGTAAVTLHFPTPSAALRLIPPDLGALAQAYIQGDIDVEGPAQDVVRTAIKLASASSTKQRVISRIIGWRVRRHTPDSDKRAIAHHYDVSNEFYRLWLDKQMVYSCAYFPTGSETLEQAEEAKLDLICRKLQLKPGDRFLDIGCGWGALLLWAQRHYGVKATGVTLSERQFEYVRERVRELGLEDSIDVRLQDYRHIPGEGIFDKIASVGMFEHVGVQNLPVYFGTIQRLLADDGLVLNHGIATRAGDESVRDSASEFIDHFVFPDGELPTIAQAVEAMESQQLEVFDVEGLRPHYARTLAHWVERLEANRDEAIRLVGEQTYRVWRIYMAGSAQAFELGWISVHQLLAAKRTVRGFSPQRWGRSHMLPAATDALQHERHA
ncbi:MULTISPECIES: SAM-dependent methyltransferase [Alcaligenaceae]|uniref:Cyclopropane-fatty-acyl-phospholipid synthase n=1 Tax=Eoetvoesiella caeni TaxID=645616 RepID=A0A366H7X6_9BURK|nr:cyclopropane-fatty-acyl-phospholipid synthase family protein [Eoetvoesiella caeni]MCI2810362.1 cyclopropane-fatty-acyl-phospholipid synthase family protein [Eoetvoesiella caeni]NYT54731.1 class I SAM-dependent methyltransferase [Eoetvoesiella caeni]RBP37102.1 cyclopropane-fatty-acyl-phospholipid synthase [Eoetvoesiella caeni]